MEWLWVSPVVEPAQLKQLKQPAVSVWRMPRLHLSGLAESVGSEECIGQMVWIDLGQLE